MVSTAAYPVRNVGPCAVRAQGSVRWLSKAANWTCPWWIFHIFLVGTNLLFNVFAVMRRKTENRGLFNLTGQRLIYVLSGRVWPKRCSHWGWVRIRALIYSLRYSYSWARKHLTVVNAHTVLGHFQWLQLHPLCPPTASVAFPVRVLKLNTYRREFMLSLL